MESKSSKLSKMDSLSFEHIDLTSDCDSYNGYDIKYSSRNSNEYKISSDEEELNNVESDYEKERKRILSYSLGKSNGFIEIEQQKLILNSFVNNGLYKKLLQNRNTRISNLNDNGIAVISDTHDDYFSLIGSFVEAGIVEFQQNKFLYYDIYSMKYVKKEEINKYNKNFIIVILLPFIVNNQYIELYHLGDFIDRGNIFESFKCTVFVDYVTKELQNHSMNSVHIAIGNHETMLEEYNNIYEQNFMYDYRQCLIYIIAKMFFDNRISTGYKVNIGGKITGLWHSALNKSRVQTMIDIVDLVINNSISRIDVLYERKEFNNLLIEKFFIYNKQKDLNVFNEEDIIDIKIGLGNLCIETFFKEHFLIEDNNHILCENLFQSHYFNRLNVEIKNRGFCNFLFWDDVDIENEPILNQIIGHQANYNVVCNNGLNNSILDIDVCRSRFCNEEYNIGLILTIFIDKNKDIDIQDDICGLIYNLKVMLNNKDALCYDSYNANKDYKLIRIAEQKLINNFRKLDSEQFYFDENHFSYEFLDDVKLLSLCENEFDDVLNNCQYSKLY